MYEVLDKDTKNSKFYPLLSVAERGFVTKSTPRRGHSGYSL